MEGATPFVNFLFRNKRKFFIGFITLDIIAVATIATILILQKVQSAKLVVSVIPTTATVTIDGKTYNNSQTYNMTPGNYTAQVSADGLESKTINFTLENDKIFTLSAYLSGNNGDLSYYTNHSDDFELLSEDSSNLDQNVQNYLSEYERISSIKDYFPIVEIINPEAHSSDGAFKIEQGYGCQKIYCLKVSYYYGEFSDQVDAKIRSLGYNPDDYEIKTEVVRK